MLLPPVGGKLGRGPNRAPSLETPPRVGRESRCHALLLREQDDPMGTTGRLRPLLRIRISRFTYLLLGLAVLQLLLMVLSLLLPWGNNAAGEDIRTTLSGLLPWFMLIPILLQMGFITMESAFLQSIYIVSDFIVSAFIVLVHYLTFIRYESDFRLGYYLLFAACGMALASGVVCMVEKRRFSRLLERGAARVVPLSIGGPG